LQNIKIFIDLLCTFLKVVGSFAENSLTEFIVTNKHFNTCIEMNGTIK
jgi:hypothetical protein